MGQIFGWEKLIHIITGQNNAGKSNLLEALYCLVGKSMHPCANLTEIYDNIRKEPLKTESKNLMFYGLDTKEEIQIVITLDNNQTLDLQIKFIASEDQKVIESQIIPTAEQTQMPSQLNFTLKKNNEEIYNDHLNIAEIPNQLGYKRQFKNFDPNQLQKLLPFESAVIIPSDAAYRQAHMIQAVSKICSNNQLEEELNKYIIKLSI